MSVGAGIALFVIGAVVAFALDSGLGGGVVDLTLIGYLLMGAGALVTLIGAVFLFKKRTHERSVVTQDGSGNVVEQSTVDKSNVANI